MKIQHFIITYIFIALFLSCSKPEGNNNVDPPEDNFTSNSVVLVDPALQSNMVLQQNSQFTITGMGTPGEKVRALCSWDNNSTSHVATVATDGKWQITVTTPVGSKTEQTIVLQGKTKVTFNNILVGEVWLCTGQSNMQWPLKNAVNGSSEVSNARYPEIRILNMARITAENPTDNFTAKWSPCSPTAVPDFSAVAYFFGKTLFTELDIPIGLIASNWGNTAAEVWTNNALILANPTLVTDIQKRSVPHTDGSPYISGSAYNAMIYPLRKIPIAGVIWYQGENNQDSPFAYPLLLETMVNGWRADWGKQFPFYIAQICPYKRMWNFSTKYSNPAMRHMMAQASEQISNSAIEVNDDIADINDIHPTNKQDVGYRLAWLALSKNYNKTQYANKRSPIYERSEVAGNKMVIYFKYADAGFKTSDGLSPTMFEIAGPDMVFYPATATIAGKTVELNTPSVPQPVSARMGWSYIKVSNLRSANDLPVSVFKTYSWHDQIEEAN